jgi:hypothetical protein
MSDLSPEHEAILDLVRDTDDPSDVQRDRVRRQLARELGVAAGLTASLSAAKVSAASTEPALQHASAAVPRMPAARLGDQTLRAVSGKLVAKTAVLAILALAGGAALFIHFSARRPVAHPAAAGASGMTGQGLVAQPRPAIEPVKGTSGASEHAARAAKTSPMGESSSRATAVASPIAAQQVTTPAESGVSPGKTPVGSPSAQSARAPSAENARSRSAENARLSSTEGTRFPTDDDVRGSSEQGARRSLDDETRLIGAADAALRAGDGASALLRLDEHARSFPDGVLAEERSAERVLALCALGRDADARTEADRFLSDRPRTPLAAKVRASCGGRPSIPH